MGYYDKSEESIRIVSLTFGLVSFVFSSLTLLLIYMMHVRNGYLLILFTMTIAQLLYDVNYMLRVDSRVDSACYASQFLDLIGGLAVSFWVNILAFSVTYTIVRCKSIEIYKHYWRFSVFGSFIPLFIGTMAVASPHVLNTADDDGPGCGYQTTVQGTFVINFYYWSRLMSAMITTLLCLFNFIKLREITTGDTNLFRTQQDVKVVARVSDFNNMFRTIYRMNFYAVAQIICRSGAAWNEWDYGRYSCFTSKMVTAVLSPSLGIFNFFIFVLMQPKAWDNLVTLLSCGGYFFKSEHLFSRDTIGSQMMTESEVLDKDVFNSMYISDSNSLSTRNPQESVSSSTDEEHGGKHSMGGLGKGIFGAAVSESRRT